jgi:hypothetical protein
MEKSTLRIKHLSTLFAQVLPLPELLQFLKQFSHESSVHRGDIRLPAPPFQVQGLEYFGDPQF